MLAEKLIKRTCQKRTDYVIRKLLIFIYIPFLCITQHQEFESCDSKANGLFSSFTFKSFWDHPNSSKEQAKGEFLKKVQRLTNTQQHTSVKKRWKLLMKFNQFCLHFCLKVEENISNNLLNIYFFPASVVINV